MISDVKASGPIIISTGWHFVTQLQEQQLLKVEFQKVIDNAEQYMHSYSTNSAESFHNSRSKLTPKRINLRLGFFVGSIISAVGVCYRHDQQFYFQWKLDILKQLDLDFSSLLYSTTSKSMIQQPEVT